MTAKCIFFVIFFYFWMLKKKSILTFSDWKNTIQYKRAKKQLQTNNIHHSINVSRWVMRVLIEKNKNNFFVFFIIFWYAKCYGLFRICAVKILIKFPKIFSSFFDFIVWIILYFFGHNRVYCIISARYSKGIKTPGNWKENSNWSNSQIYCDTEAKRENQLCSKVDKTLWEWIDMNA